MHPLPLTIGSIAHALTAIRRAWTAESANPKAVYTYLASPMAQAAPPPAGNTYHPPRPPAPPPGGFSFLSHPLPCHSVSHEPIR